DDDRKGPPALGTVRRQRDRDGLDREGDHLAVPGIGRADPHRARQVEAVGARGGAAAAPRAAVAWPLLAKIALVFAEAGAFVFGSGLAIVPFLHGSVVNQYGWLTE